MSEDLSKRLDRHPELKKRVEKILDIAENTSGECNTADEAEQSVIEEIRKLGQEVVQDWANEQNSGTTATFREKNPEATVSKKKGSTGQQLTES